MGEAEGEINALLKALVMRFYPGASADLEADIRATTDRDQLRNWIDLAIAVDSLDTFRRAAGL